MRCIGDIPRLNARRYPEKKALIMGDEHMTFNVLNELSNKLASGLISMGIKPGDKVAVMAQNCLEFPVILYATAKCGAIFVPINFRYEKKELIYVVNNSDPKILFFDAENASVVKAASVDFSNNIQMIAISPEKNSDKHTMKGIMAEQPGVNPVIPVEPDSAAMIMYTSGTTGFPKGVLYSHAAYIAVYFGMVLEGDLHHEDVTMVALPLFHNGGLNALLQPTLMLGGSAVIMAKGFDPGTILEAIQRYKVTMTMWVPTMLALLVNSPDASNYDVTSLKKIWYGSSPISPSVYKKAVGLFNTRFYQWFGQTETGMNSILRPEDHATRSHFTGREIFNSEIRIVDEKGNDVREGEIGQIISAQKPLGMIGYLNMDEATRETIRDGWIYTGDLARAEVDGFFTIVDRMKDLIISGAENIYPKEVEDVICDHPDVMEVSVIGIPDDIYGESVLAVVVPKKGRQLTESTIIEFSSKRLARYKKPKKVIFTDELPKNAAGKVTKNVLREPFWTDKGKKI
ncbi:MAG: long-chain fatty acid--CoA ligase [Proteobacteria bacterium]|nr:long-chain fatty acid--CoA ligase [Pseudomonadota bacterium]